MTVADYLDHRVWRHAQEADVLREQRREEHDLRAQEDEDAEYRRDSRPLEGSDQE